MLVLPIVACLIASCVGVSSDAPDNRGTEFIIGFMDSGQSNVDTRLFISTASSENVQVRVTSPRFLQHNAMVVDETFNITYGEMRAVDLDHDIAADNDEFDSKGILVEATEEISVHTEYRSNHENDGFMAIPTNALGTEYISVSYSPSRKETQFLIIATEDDTTVEITLPDNDDLWIRYLHTSYVAKETITVQMQKFDSWQVQSHKGDLTGTLISSNKPISVFSGNEETNVGPDKSYDHLVEQLPATSTWGKQFAFVTTPGRTDGDLLRFVAAEDDTNVQVSCSGGFSDSFNIDARKFYDIDTLTEGACSAQSDKGVMLIQFIKSQKDRREYTDPSMIVIYPVEQFTSAYSFATPISLDSKREYQAYITIVIKDSEKDGLLLDGEPLPAPTYVSLPNSALVGTYVEITEGAHILQHTSPITTFGGMIYGAAEKESYGMPFGARMSNINVVCTPTASQVGDGIDNDCDGLIDEELCAPSTAGVDEDGDGSVDEDCAQVNGNWGEWGDFSDCSVTCAVGTKTRTRECNDLSPQGPGFYCWGDDSDMAECDTAIDCPSAPDNRGTEYILAFMENKRGKTEVELFVTTSRQHDVTVRVTSPKYFDRSGNMMVDAEFTVTAGYIHNLELDQDMACAGTELDHKGIHVEADDEIVVYGTNLEKSSNDGFLGLPVDVLGTEYYTVSYSPSSDDNEFLIVATEDNTDVQILLPNDEDVEIEVKDDVYRDNNKRRKRDLNSDTNESMFLKHRVKRGKSSKSSKSSSSKKSKSKKSKSSKTKSVKPVSKVKSVKPVSKVKSAKSVSKVKSVKPVSKVKSVKSASKVKSVKPVSRAKSVKPVSKVKSVKSASKVKSVKPVSKVKSVKSASKVKSVKPVSKVKSVKPISNVKSVKSKSASKSKSGSSSKSSKKSKSSKVKSVKPVSKVKSVKPVSKVKSVKPISNVKSVKSKSASKSKSGSSSKSSKKSKSSKVKSVKPVSKVKSVKPVSKVKSVKPISNVKSVKSKSASKSKSGSSSKSSKKSKSSKVKSVKPVSKVKSVKPVSKVKSVKPISNVKSVKSKSASKSKSGSSSKSSKKSKSSKVKSVKPVSKVKSVKPVSKVKSVKPISNVKSVKSKSASKSNSGSSSKSSKKSKSSKVQSVKPVSKVKSVKPISNVKSVKSKSASKSKSGSSSKSSNKSKSSKVKSVKPVSKVISVKSVSNVKSVKSKSASKSKSGSSSKSSKKSKSVSKVKSVKSVSNVKSVKSKSASKSKSGSSSKSSKKSKSSKVKSVKPVSKVKSVKPISNVKSVKSKSASKSKSGSSSKSSKKSKSSKVKSVKTVSKVKSVKSKSASKSKSGSSSKSSKKSKSSIVKSVKPVSKVKSVKPVSKVKSVKSVSKVKSVKSKSASKSKSGSSSKSSNKSKSSKVKTVKSVSNVKSVKPVSNVKSVKSKSASKSKSGSSSKSSNKSKSSNVKSVKTVSKVKSVKSKSASKSKSGSSSKSSNKSKSSKVKTVKSVSNVKSVKPVSNVKSVKSKSASKSKSGSSSKSSNKSKSSNVKSVKTVSKVKSVKSVSNVKSVKSKTASKSKSGSSSKSSKKSKSSNVKSVKTVSKVKSVKSVSNVKSVKSKTASKSKSGSSSKSSKKSKSSNVKSVKTKSASKSKSSKSSKVKSVKSSKSVKSVSSGSSVISAPPPSVQVLEGDYEMNDVITLSLDRFDTFQAQSKKGDTTGTRIVSNKPIAVFSGNVRAYVLPKRSWDHLVEQLLPVESWGKTFAIVPTPERTNTGDTIRFVSSVPNTEIWVTCSDGFEVELTVDDRQYEEIEIASEAMCYVEATEGIMVALFVKSETDRNEPTDPSMILIPPIGQYGAAYTFTTPKNSKHNREYQSYVNFMVKDAAKDGLLLDGMPLPANTVYNPIPETQLVGGFVKIDEGAHTLLHQSPIEVFGAILYGATSRESYGMPLGMRLAEINVPCFPSTMSMGDGINNDCDDLIDEELCGNGIDDDGDGVEDEDCAPNPPVNGNWSDWTYWSDCSEPCGDVGTIGEMSRTRSCTDPEPSEDGMGCVGNDTEAESCSPTTPCFVDGGWGQWEDWAACSVPCDVGTRDRFRTCDDPEPYGAGADCVGDDSETGVCDTQVICPVHGGFSDWGAWSSCPVTCGTSIATRTRSCDNPTPDHGGRDCVGTYNETQSCDSGSVCLGAVDGGFSAWTTWGSCSVTCGSGTKDRNRTCDDPAPQHGGNDCVGDTSETTACDEGNCPIDGGFSAWTTWGSCSVTCGSGTKDRTRSCDDPAPQHGGNDCVGDTSETTACDEGHCPIDGGLSAWTTWGSCSVTCGSGTKDRSRSCDDPAPQHGGSDCVGDTSETTACDEGNCPINGGFSDWVAWSSCPVTCGTSTATRTRSCDNPTPQHGGTDCVGDTSETQSCDSGTACVGPVDGAFSDWTTWGSCSATCGSGTKDRSRSCDNPPPQNGGTDCVGDTSETTACDEGNCPIDGGFSAWTTWGSCSVTCGSGTKDRSRSCDDPAPQHGGNDCVGDTSETTACDEGNCPINGGFSDWGAWSSCPVTCGTSTATRTRSCDDPTPQHGGTDCVGDTSETLACDSGTACVGPVDGGFSDWATWGSCSVTCGSGTKDRSRSCDNPPPQNGGTDCVGDTSETTACDEGNCPINGGFTDWGAWSSCPVTCGTSTATRTRSCDNPTPQYGGTDCVGDTSETQACDSGTACVGPVDGGFTSWTTWGSCSVTCGSGTKDRSRSCDNPPPQNGGTDCVGDTSETTACDEGNCPINGGFTDWGSWSSCPVTCGTSTATRTRSCDNPTPQHGGADCVGDTSETQSCDSGTACVGPVDGGFSAWATWGSCSVTCGSGTKDRSRSCDNPPPQNGGNGCVGDTSETIACDEGSCPGAAPDVDGNWGNWQNWIPCTKTCGGGITMRTRECNNPAPSGNGEFCEGTAFEMGTCKTTNCPSPYGGTSGSYVNRCPQGFFTCRSGSIVCVQEIFRCDCMADCDDHTDEDESWAGCTVDQLTICRNSASAIGTWNGVFVILLAVHLVARALYWK